MRYTSVQVLKVPTPAQANATSRKSQSGSRKGVQLACRRPIYEKNSVSRTSAPISSTAPEKLMAPHCFWLRRTSFSSTPGSALMVNLELACWHCQACCNFSKYSSRFIVGSFQLISQLFANAIQFHADIVF